MDTNTLMVSTILKTKGFLCHMRREFYNKYKIVSMRHQVKFLRC